MAIPSWPLAIFEKSARIMLVGILPHVYNMESFNDFCFVQSAKFGQMYLSQIFGRKLLIRNYDLVKLDSFLNKFRALLIFE